MSANKEVSQEKEHSSKEVADDEEQEVIYEEVPPLQVIETGDSIKVKQVLDDAAMAAIVGAGYEANYSWDNFKMFLMFLSCAFAMLAQFYPLPFPESRLLLAVCCGMYFFLSTVLQGIVVFIDKDMIMRTKPNEKFNEEMVIRTNFPRFQEYFTLKVQGKDPDSPATTGKMYVGKYFTSKGEFDEEGFAADVKRHIEKYVNKHYVEIGYNHKLD